MQFPQRGTRRLCSLVPGRCTGPTLGPGPGQGQLFSSHGLPGSCAMPRSRPRSLQTDRALSREALGESERTGVSTVVGGGDSRARPAHTPARGGMAGQPHRLHSHAELAHIPRTHIPTCSDAAQTGHRGSHLGGVQGCQHPAQGCSPRPHLPPARPRVGPLAPQSCMHTHTHITRFTGHTATGTCGDGQAGPPTVLQAVMNTVAPSPPRVPGHYGCPRHTVPGMCTR